MGSSEVTLSEQLKEHTNKVHKNLEKKLDIFQLLNNLQSYKHLLSSLYIFYRSLEEKISHIPDLTVPFFPKRSLLEKDLEALGVNAQSLPPCPVNSLPECMNAAQATGILYVLEGSTLGGQVISRHLHEALRLDENNGAAFYQGYGADTGLHWQKFKSALNAAGEELNSNEILTSAEATFLAMEHWLCRS